MSAEKIHAVKPVIKHIEKRIATLNILIQKREIKKSNGEKMIDRKTSIAMSEDLPINKIFQKHIQTNLMILTNH